MRVNPYIEPLLTNVTELLNRPAADAVELERRWEEHCIPTQRPADESDLRLVRTFVRRWSGVVDAESEPERVGRLNDLLRRYTVAPSIASHDGSGWHLHHRDPEAGFGATFAGSTAAAAAHYLSDRGMHRLGRCAAADCTAAFVDFSRPGRQRYCTHACANRAAVRRHRASAARR